MSSHIILNESATTCESASLDNVDIFGYLADGTAVFSRELDSSLAPTLVNEKKSDVIREHAYKLRARKVKNSAIYVEALKQSDGLDV